MPVSGMYDYKPGSDIRPNSSDPRSNVGWVDSTEAARSPQPGAVTPPMRPEHISAQMPVRGRAMLSLSAGAMIVIIGVLLFFIGSIILQTSLIVEPPESEDFDHIDDWEERDKKEEKAYENYDDTMRNMVGVGKVLNWVGSMFIVLPLYFIGISNQELDWKVRASMLSTATAIVIAVIIVTMFYGMSPIY